MAAALAIVWAAAQGPGHRDSASNDHGRPGNGQPYPSTILVVEDEVLIRLAICDFLRGCGYRVLEASTGEEAQVVFRSGEAIEILFSDVELGRGMNGFALATWVRETYPGVRVLLTSGVARMAEEAGHLCDGPFLSKPYSHQDLAKQIADLLKAFSRQSGG